MMACSTLLAALAIRPYDATVVGLGEEAQAQDADRRLRMATILGFTVVSMTSSQPLCVCLLFGKGGGGGGGR